MGVLVQPAMPWAKHTSTVVCRQHSLSRWNPVQQQRGAGGPSVALMPLDGCMAAWLGSGRRASSSPCWGWSTGDEGEGAGGGVAGAHLQYHTMVQYRSGWAAGRPPSAVCRLTVGQFARGARAGSVKVQLAAARRPA